MIFLFTNIQPESGYFVLMENAGRGIVDYFLKLERNGKVVICCGGGNNGGDGFVVARHLSNHKVPVQILLFTNPDTLNGDAKTNYGIVTKSEIPIKVQTHDEERGWAQY